MHAFTLSMLAIIATLVAIPHEARIVVVGLIIVTGLYVISEQLIQGNK